MTNQMARDAFTKGFENKWMVCEDAGIFAEPSGKHSERIGELKVGDIIEAEAETFDPDNKVIWRLVSPQKGGWIYAPVRGPKTCVPLTEENLKLAENTTFWKVTGKKGTIVRKDKELDSEQVQIIPKDTVCHVVGSETLESGKERFKITKPVEGYITAAQVTKWYIS